MILDCIDDTSFYSGQVNRTETGRACQKWDSDVPHNRNNKVINGQYPEGNIEHNYCRDPADKYDKVWCYTEDPNKRWEWCPVAKCPGKFYTFIHPFL